MGDRTESAAQRARQVVQQEYGRPDPRSAAARLAAHMAEGSDINFRHLGVKAREGRIRYLGPFGRDLGPLAGACAGILETHGATAAGVIGAIITPSVPPRTGTLFVAIQGRRRLERPLRVSSPRELAEVQQQIDRFNALVDIVTEEVQSLVATREICWDWLQTTVGP